MSHDQIGKTRMEFTDSKWVQMIFEITLRFLNTVIPQKKYAPNRIPAILCTRRCQTKQLGPSRVDILSKIHKLKVVFPYLIIL